MSWLPPPLSPRTAPTDAVPVTTAEPHALPTAAASTQPPLLLVPLVTGPHSRTAYYRVPADTQPRHPPPANPVRTPRELRNAAVAEANEKVARQERLAMARQRLKDAREVYRQVTGTAPRHNSVAAHRERAALNNISTGELTRQYKMSSARKAVGRDGAPLFVRPDGSVDLAAWERQHSRQSATHYSPDGGITFPFRVEDGRGGWTGDSNAYWAHMRKLRAMKPLGADGQPRFYNRETGTVNVSGFERWQRETRQQRPLTTPREFRPRRQETLEMAAARTFLDAAGNPRFVTDSGMIQVGLYRREIDITQREKAEFQEFTRREQASGGADDDTESARR